MKTVWKSVPVTMVMFVTGVMAATGALAPVPAVTPVAVSVVTADPDNNGGGGDRNTDPAAVHGGNLNINVGGTQNWDSDDSSRWTGPPHGLPRNGPPSGGFFEAFGFNVPTHADRDREARLGNDYYERERFIYERERRGPDRGWDQWPCVS